jgi:hypothetical protein
VLLHDQDFTDLTACTFWLAPGQSLQPYTMRGFAAASWESATLSLYGATVGTQQWIRFDNASLKRTPGAVIAGTECDESGAADAVSALDRVTSGGSIRTGTTAGVRTTSGSETGSQDLWLDGARLDAFEWQAIGSAPGVQTMPLPVAIDITSPAEMVFRSQLRTARSRARIEVSVDGRTWRRVAGIDPRQPDAIVSVRLAAPGYDRLLVRFAFATDAEKGESIPPDSWHVSQVRVLRR